VIVLLALMLRPVTVRAQVDAPHAGPLSESTAALRFAAWVDYLILSPEDVPPPIPGETFDAISGAQVSTDDDGGPATVGPNELVTGNRLSDMVDALQVAATQDNAEPVGQRRPPLKPIGTVDLQLRPLAGAMPEDFGARYFDAQDRVPRLVVPGERCDTLVAWYSPGLYHHPLYFQDINLERYGWGRGCLQPAFSAAHFFGRIPALPYMLTAWPCRERMYVLGHAPPGSPMPRYRYRPRLRAKAASVEAAAAVGMVFLVP
jgi:hypothetical protein